MADKYWFKFGGQVFGPFDLARIRQLAESKKLRPNFMFSTDKQNWKELGDIPSFLKKLELKATSKPVPSNTPVQDLNKQESADASEKKEQSNHVKCRGCKNEFPPDQTIKLSANKALCGKCQEKELKEASFGGLAVVGMGFFGAILIVALIYNLVINPSVPYRSSYLSNGLALAISAVLILLIRVVAVRKLKEFSQGFQYQLMLNSLSWIVTAILVLFIYLPTHWYAVHSIRMIPFNDALNRAMVAMEKHKASGKQELFRRNQYLVYERDDDSFIRDRWWRANPNNIDFNKPFTLVIVENKDKVVGKYVKENTERYSFEAKQTYHTINVIDFPDGRYLGSSTRKGNPPARKLVNGRDADGGTKPNIVKQMILALPSKASPDE